jgi:hypothetical protein
MKRGVREARVEKLAGRVLGFRRSFALAYATFEGEIPLDFVPK